jgi:hypothetical protein
LALFWATAAKGSHGTLIGGIPGGGGYGPIAECARTMQLKPGTVLTFTTRSDVLAYRQRSQHDLRDSGSGPAVPLSRGTACGPPEGGMRLRSRVHSADQAMPFERLPSGGDSTYVHERPCQPALGALAVAAIRYWR